MALMPMQCMVHRRRPIFVRMPMMCPLLFHSNSVVFVVECTGNGKNICGRNGYGGMGEGDREAQKVCRKSRDGGMDGIGNRFVNEITFLFYELHRDYQ